MDAATSPLTQELDQASQPYVGRWNTLVSTTNWEKGRIIAEWRRALERSGAAAAEFADEAWARRVGCITGQHVGRLRRVWDRFGHQQEQYERLFWSHFQAALDWNDAEMWLEGAVQNRWSVTQMRHTRWETLGKVAQENPEFDAVVTGELDEDFETAGGRPIDGGESPAERAALVPEIGDVRPIELGRGESSRSRDSGAKSDRPARERDEDEEESPASPKVKREAAATVRPFAELPRLPDDVAEAFEQFKLVLLRHKTGGWKEISREDLVASLDALKELALAPSGEEDGAPF